ncbi:MAG: flagellar assembly protein T N-terminal domain-containing protein [Smithellaceae bacterium]|nr:flagellar assembly protein T N-terminal domain-containing protein [Smithellaceae bacterium]
MRIHPCLLALILLFCFAIPDASAQTKCINANGEAAIIRNDTPSAKLEAIARAKWTAIEQVVGTEIKAQSFVQNFTLVEDVIKTKTGGVVKSYKVVGENVKDDILNVTINACVEPSQAREAVSQLGLNSSIALFIPARKPGRSGDEFEETNILSETLIGKLIEQGYTVVDVAPTRAIDAMEVERAMRSGSTLALRGMMYKFLSNLIIIGKVDYTISTKKGENIGYGLSMPFNNVTVRLNYRIISKNNKTGNMEILTTGVEQAKGLANNVEDATAEAMKELAQNLTPAILDKVSQYIKGNTKKVAVKVKGVDDIDKVLEIKQILQSIVWVSSVEEKQMGDFVVSYPENTLYLANSIKQKGNLKIVNFSPYSLTLEYLE